VTETAICLEGHIGDWLGQSSGRACLDCVLDLQRQVTDERFLRVSPHTTKLSVHQFRLGVTQLDDSLAGWAQERTPPGAVPTGNRTDPWCCPRRPGWMPTLRLWCQSPGAPDDPWRPLGSAGFAGARESG